MTSSFSPLAASGDLAVAARSALHEERLVRRIWRGARRYPSLVAGGAIVGSILAVALLAPVLAPHDPLRGDLLARLTPPFWSDTGSADNLLGTDQQGRDQLSRLIHGARVSLTVGIVASVLAGLIGTTLGILAGYYRGIVDKAIMLLTDTMMAFPLILLALLIVAMLGHSLVNLIVVFTLTNWFISARVARGTTFQLSQAEFVVASRLMGASDARVLRRHVVPNIIGPLIVVASFAVAEIIITEAALGFLGLGVAPPSPSWGSMLADGREYVNIAWWVSVVPGLALVITILGFNLLGDGLRDLLDPRSKS
ncbi:MAG: ABC transporter permease [Thermomicrobiales bacterium]|nr:ABC transporter permease [Thermomicrobiales bacterium]